MTFDEWLKTDAGIAASYGTALEFAKAAWLAAYRVGEDRGRELRRDEDAEGVER